MCVYFCIIHVWVDLSVDEFLSFSLNTFVFFWVSVVFSCSQVVQYRPREPRVLSGLSPSLSVWTLEVWTILRHRRCLSLCPSSSSRRLPAAARPRNRSAAPTPRTGTPLCPSWTASSLKRPRPPVEKVRLTLMWSVWRVHVVFCATVDW